MVVGDVCRHPIGCGEGVSGTLPLLIASGDAFGRVVVWDVGSGDAVAVLGDAGLASGLSQGRGKLAIRGVSWVSASHVLAILLEQGKLLMWDCTSRYLM